MLVSGEKLVTGDIGDSSSWRPKNAGTAPPRTAPARRRGWAITPRLKEGQVHYMQPSTGGGRGLIGHRQLKSEGT